jgi:hypothetical protein
LEKENMNTEIKSIREVLNVHGQNGNWNCNPYMLGLYNGMELALALLESRDPNYRSMPEFGWLDNRVPIGYIPTVADDVHRVITNIDAENLSQIETVELIDKHKQ